LREHAIVAPTRLASAILPTPARRLSFVAEAAIVIVPLEAIV
jgi:hypothetical protein